MSRQSLKHLAQALFWEHNLPLRRIGRRLTRGLSLTKLKFKTVCGRRPDPRVLSLPEESNTPETPHPAILVIPAPNAATGSVEAFLQSQTERSACAALPPDKRLPFVFQAEGPLDGLPATHLESLLMAAVAEDLDWTVTGWAAPAPGRYGPSGHVARSGHHEEASNLLLRLPRPPRNDGSVVVGRAVPHITNLDHLRECRSLDHPFTRSSGAYRLRSDTADGAIVRQCLHAVDASLSNLPEIDGPRTAMFLLPYLAVGGAEKLLADLVRGLGSRYRILIATTDPHLASLGQSVDRFRDLTPHVYTLGDWLPPGAVPSAIRHLLRRWQVECLVCWNGNVVYYDHVADFKARFPSLRIVNQLYNHEGGWIEHYCPTVERATDLHIAVNTPTASALIDERSVPRRSVATIHHGVEIPEEATREEHELRKRQRRDQIGVPQDSLIVGTFVRMHPQKRPLDIIRVARMLEDEGVHFLLVGGGPMDQMVDAELKRNCPGNLTRLPMREDALDLYDAIDICLLTSSFEGLPVFLLDGLARAIPCVAPGVGDIPLLLRDGGGVVVERAGDIEGLASGIRRLKDSDLRTREGLLGRSTVSMRFGVDVFASAYEAAIFPER